MFQNPRGSDHRLSDAAEQDISCVGYSVRSLVRRSSHDGDLPAGQFPDGQGIHGGTADGMR